MKKIGLIVAFFVLFLINGCFLNKDVDNEITNVNTRQTPTSHTVLITDNGFEPKTLTIKQGDTVVWVNKGELNSWPASAIHPTHDAYPEPGGCSGSKFDACKELATDDSWEFTFNYKGTWSYHDHIKLGARASGDWTGKIIVE